MIQRLFLRESAKKCTPLGVINAGYFLCRWRVLEMSMEQQGLTEEEVCVCFLRSDCVAVTKLFYSIHLPAFPQYD